MKKSDKRNNRRKKRASPFLTILQWGAALAVVAVIIYGVSQTTGVVYDDDDIKVVNFSGLTSTGKRHALQAANRAQCTCGCGMTLAQCVATDSTCPIREPNIERIKTMVREADRS